ncbi:uncharacterized protein LOC144631580 isoform X2 [Oculina patagonica]
MPSASSQSSMQITAPMENNDLPKNVLNLLEKKVRNLEKRKGKLDSYKKLVDAGETLNEDQKLAVSQLGQVEQNLEFARDLQKNITQICNDHVKLQKKMAKRDQAAMVAAQRDGDISKVCQVLELQALMDNLSEDVRVDFLNGTNGAVVVSEENFVQIDEFYKLITPNADGDEPIKEQQMAASRHIVKFLDASPEAVVGTTYKALNELVASIKKCGYFEQSQEDEEEEEEEEAEEEAAVEGENDEDQQGSGDDNAQLIQNQTVDSTNGPSDTHVNGGNTATSNANEGGNMATFASNEHGLNFLSESEVESKPQTVAEPPAPVEKPTKEAPPESSGFGASGADEGWVEQGGDRNAADQGDDTGFDTVHHSNGFSRGGRGGRGGFRRGDGYNRRGGPPGERGNRRGRGGFSGPPRGGRGGGFGQQQDNHQRHGGPSGRGSRGGPPRGGPRGDRGGRRGGGAPQ